MNGSELPPLSSDFEWRYENEVLSLVHRKKRLKPLSIDWLAAWSSLRIGVKDPFARALGMRVGCSQVVDTTVGLGGDLIKSLKLGLHVIGIERSPILFALIQDALIRAEAQEWWKEQVSPRLSLHFGSAENLLNQIPTARREVIYVDPMYPQEGKTAASSREMQYLQELLGADVAQTETLLQQAIALRPRRVVLKRPSYAKEIAAVSAPQLEIKGQSVRYEIWLPSSGVPPEGG